MRNILLALAAVTCLSASAHAQRFFGGAVGYNPQIDVVSSGTVLDVQATVSADRKYVTLNMRPQVTNVVALRTFPTVAGTSTVGDGNARAGEGRTILGRRGITRVGDL